MASIEPRGKSWRASIFRKGIRLTATRNTRTEVEAWAVAEEQRIDEGATAPQIRKSPNTISVASLFDRYAREVSPEKRGGRWEVVRLRALAIAPEFQGAAADLDGADLAGWRDRRLRDVKASTINRDLNLISAVFARAMKEWRLQRKMNPVRDVMRPAQPRERMRRVPDEDRDAVVKQLGWDRVSEPTDLNEWVAWAFVFALETGMRQGEILGMRHGDVKTRHVHIPLTKNGDARNVPLSTAARALLALIGDRKPGQKIVPLESGTCGAYFREACRGACVEDLHFHDARHEAATRFAEKVEMQELARILGHRDTRSTMAYYHPDIDGLADKLD